MVRLVSGVPEAVEIAKLLHVRFPPFYSLGQFAVFLMDLR
jgi:hypothetical protein